ncbi:PREDICTED: serum response factor-binding protein 1-like [Vollenhovia emeryi]|uniref:serum response factor-binding protein 1-like n=1 Tax=Vollenhovia emeryi TaxID=411798 RepID=UPI0005F53AF3|nr:PREDICTED: serum response factor-binding protein 1-like [Vollenhovia emeryi]
MAKSEINNEFILLRHAVRQARVCVLNKLIKEAKLLRDRHGNEAQRAKCARKADKLVAEVYALKTIKDDEISRFGILNERDLTEILMDQSSSSGTRIMARVANYKTLDKRLAQFKERFPDCKEHLAEKKKKKTTKVTGKDAAKTRKSKENNTRNKGSKKQKIDSGENVEQPQRNKAEACNESSETRGSSCKRKRTSDDVCTEKRKLPRGSASEAAVVDKQSSVIKPSGVTKEATVKRFAELLEEQESHRDAQMSVENQESASTAAEQAKSVDDFFIAGDGQNYQGNDASTSYKRSQRYNTRAKALQSNDQIKEQNANRKNERNFSKRYPDKQSFVKSKRTAFNNKSANKSNASETAINNKRDEDTSLHPSWMAKKKEQEIIRRGFQGKKIVFTDD